MINGDNAGMVDRPINRDDQPLHNSIYEIDGIPNEIGEEEYEKSEIDTIAKNYLKSMANKIVESKKRKLNY